MDRRVHIPRYVPARAAGSPDPPVLRSIADRTSACAHSRSRQANVPAVRCVPASLNKVPVCGGIGSARRVQGIMGPDGRKRPWARLLHGLRRRLPSTPPGFRSTGRNEERRTLGPAFFLWIVTDLSRTCNVRPSRRPLPSVRCTSRHPRGIERVGQGSPYPRSDPSAPVRAPGWSCSPRTHRSPL